LPDLVIAGEPSGDRTLAAIVRVLNRPAFGIGGDALASAGVELVAHARDLSAMGTVEVLRRAPQIVSALRELFRAIDRVRPKLALLASWSTANGWIAPLLRRRGIKVVWISPPEIWAWRASRAPRLACAADRLIVTLPFEEQLWRRHGADAHYVGHPVVDTQPIDLRLPRPSLAILPGSRESEIRRLLPRMLAAARMIPIEARVIVAPSLAPSLVSFIESFDVPTITASEHGAAPLLPSFDVALVASGTASLECAAMGTPPVVAYAAHPATIALGRRLVRTPHIALPNVLLGRRAFIELVQDDATPAALADAVQQTRGDRTRRDACAEVRTLLGAGPFAERAAALANQLLMQ
jgi:lipid-A-disaccharide synthase